MSCSRRLPQRPHGFTLVELLVTIGIIAVIIGMLLPALARARQSAQNLKCVANLRTLGQCLVLHANDHRGFLPLAGNIAPGKDLNGLDDPQTLGDGALQKYVYYQNTPGVTRVTAMPIAMAPYLVSQPVRSDSWQNVDADLQVSGPLQDAFTCPLDQNTIERTYGAPQWIHNYAGAPSQTTFLNGWSSYGVNAEIFGWTDVGNNGTTGHSRARGCLAAIPNPTETMLMCDTYEAIEIWVLAPQLSLGDVYLGTGGTASSSIFDVVRHRGRMNILYADGHVDSQPILSNGATSVSGNVGDPGNSPSGGLMSVSIDKDFR